MSDTASAIYIDNTKGRAAFGEEGPKPQFLINAPGFEALVVGLKAGQQIPVHPAELAMYHFLEGTGSMTVGDETFKIQPGVTVIAPDGMPRGMQAETQVIFLGAKVA